MFNNQRFCFVLFICSIILVDVCSGSIERISSFSQIPVDDIINYEESVLFVTDVDSTLVEPTDRILAPDGRLHEFIKNNNMSLSRTRADYIKQQAHRPLIERDSLVVINKLREVDIPVIACTAMRSGETSPNFIRHHWRYDHLSSLGLFFSFCKDYWFREEADILFYQGIMFTNAQEKGPSLALFFEEYQFEPKVLVMVDDLLYQLESVEKMCKKKGIKFVGYHYHSPVAVKELDAQLALFQINYLKQTGTWLSDCDTLKNMRDCENVALYEFKARLLQHLDIELNDIEARELMRNSRIEFAF